MMIPTIRAEFTSEEDYYPIEIIIPNKWLTIEEAKDVINKLQTAIDIAEWSIKSNVKA